MTFVVLKKMSGFPVAQNFDLPSRSTINDFSVTAMIH